MPTLETKISHFLRIGVLVAGFFLLAGWMQMWSRDSSRPTTDFATYYPQSLSESLQWAILTHDRAVFMCFVGLFILVLLPVLRVLLTGILFMQQKAYPLAAMAFLVFFSLIFSFFLGINLK